MGVTPDRNDPRINEIDDLGMQKAYVVDDPSTEEEKNAYVRPVRYAYIHQKCGGLTTMGARIAETYARNPSFYGGTYCVKCQGHFPVGENGEFVWDKSDEKVGT